MLSFMDIIVLAAGIYLLYGYYLLMFKNEIKSGVIVSKDVNPKKCKDLEGFKKYIGPRLLIFALAAVASGGLGLYQTYVNRVPAVVYWVLYALFFAVIIWFAVATKKAQKEFF